MSASAQAEQQAGLSTLPSIRLDKASLDYPIYNVDSRSLHHAALSATTGGLLRRSKQNVAIVRALDEINLTIRAGDRIGLRGHNGAGKTTLLRVIAGIYPPTSGTVRITGRVSAMFSPSIGINPEFSGYENIAMQCMLLGLSDRQIGDITPRIAEFSELGDYLHLPVRTYSAGMKSRLGFSVSTSIEPEILLLDEWLSVADRQFKAKAAKRMDEFVAHSSILVIASHSHDLLRRVCTKIVNLEHGRIVDITDERAAA